MQTRMVTYRRGIIQTQIVANLNKNVTVLQKPSNYLHHLHLALFRISRISLDLALVTQKNIDEMVLAS